MQAGYLPPVTAPQRAFSAKAFLLILASSFTSHLATAQASEPSPAAAAANADMLSWMTHGLLAAVVGLTVLTCLVLFIAFTTARRPDSRPLAPAQTPAAPPQSGTATPAEFLAAMPAQRVAA
jgi:hypothetical protein